MTDSRCRGCSRIVADVWLSLRAAGFWCVRPSAGEAVEHREYRICHCGRMLVRLARGAHADCEQRRMVAEAERGAP